ncbi:MAG: isochorismatase family protein [bacterium]|nr:isochorismatase family protein [bacterium]
MAEVEQITIGPRDVLLVNDATPTFMPGGGLPVPGGNEVVPVIRKLMSLFPKERRIATKERHPRGHIALASSYRSMDSMTRMTYELLHRRVYEAGVNGVLESHAKFDMHDLRRYLDAVGAFMLWTDHSIVGTAEAELHPDLPESEFGYVLVKGQDPREHSYSAFRGDTGTPTELADILRDLDCSRIIDVGLAFDYCAGWTAVFGVDEGFKAVVVEDATRSVGFPAGSIEDMRARFFAKGIPVVQSTDLIAG